MTTHSLSPRVKLFTLWNPPEGTWSCPLCWTSEGRARGWDAPTIQVTAGVFSLHPLEQWQSWVVGLCVVFIAHPISGSITTLLPA